MAFILPFLYFLIFLWFLYKLPFFKTSGLTFKELSILFSLKIISGIFLTLIYTYYYTDRGTADIFKYFDDARIIAKSFWQSPIDYFKLLSGIKCDVPEMDIYLEDTKNWYEKTEAWLKFTNTKNYNFFNSNRLVTRFNLIVLWFSFGNFYVHVVFICFMAMTGLTAIFKLFNPLFPNRKYLLTAVIFLMPSMLLWSSGVLKEGLILFFLGLFLYFFLKENSRFTFKEIVFIVVLLYFILLCKYYVLAALLPGIAAHIWIQNTSSKKAFVKYLTVYVIVILANGLVTLVLPKYSLQEVIANKRYEAIHSAKLGNAKSVIFNDNITPDTISFLKKIPQTIFDTLFKPFISLGQPFLILFAALENLLFILTLVIGILFFNRKFMPSPPFYFFTSYTLLMILIIGFTSPVLGGLIRYKILFMPFLLILILMVTDLDRLERIIRRK